MGANQLACADFRSKWLSICTPVTYRFGGNKMEIQWRHDVDNVLKESARGNRQVLLDFSAAPM